MAAIQDLSEGGSSSRTRRRVSRVNYAEDTSFDEGIADPTDDLSESNLGNPSLPGKVLKLVSVKQASLPAKKDNLLGQSSKRGNDTALEKIPMNWQPKYTSANSMLGMLDFHFATIKSDSSLHLADGTIFSPEGNIFLYFCNYGLRLTIC